MKINKKEVEEAVELDKQVAKKINKIDEEYD